MNIWINAFNYFTGWSLYEEWVLSVFKVAVTTAVDQHDVAVEPQSYKDNVLANEIRVREDSNYRRINHVSTAVYGEHTLSI